MAHHIGSDEPSLQDNFWEFHELQKAYRDLYKLHYGEYPSKEVDHGTPEDPMGVHQPIKD